ncbi:MAG: CvpA family protein, partial [Gaiellaceae bacterium]
MNLADWVAIAIVLLAAVGGLRRGLVLSAFSLVGLAAGAYIGSRLAPHVLHGG